MKFKTKIPAAFPVPEVSAFPKLFRGKGKVRDNLIVLFISKSTGIVVSDSSRPAIEGTVESGFISCTDNKCWEPLPANSRVTFTQE